MTKEKLIKIIYLNVFFLIFFYYFIYPMPNKSIASNYFIKLTTCYIEISKSTPSKKFLNHEIPKISPEVEKFFNDHSKKVYEKACPGQSPSITISANNFNYYVFIIISFLFISLNLIVWKTRKYAVCLVFYLNKGLKNIFKKI